MVETYNFSNYLSIDPKIIGNILKMTRFTTSHAQNKSRLLPMENQQPSPAWAPTPAPLLKDSIRDMIRLQQAHQIPDELYWEIFNTRVLLNQPIDVNALFNARNIPFGQA